MVWPLTSWSKTTFKKMKKTRSIRQRYGLWRVKNITRAYIEEMARNVKNLHFPPRQCATTYGSPDAGILTKMEHRTSWTSFLQSWCGATWFLAVSNAKKISSKSKVRYRYLSSLRLWGSVSVCSWGRIWVYYYVEMGWMMCLNNDDRFFEKDKHVNDN